MGPNPIWLVFLEEEEIWTHKEEPGMHGHRGKTMWRHSKKTATCKSKRKVSEEREPVDTQLLDFQAPELWENKFLFFKSPNLWYFVIAALAN